uniref:Reverse transcriptase domain-containing protein n=1 Tax=Bracon brevicornis TaxID=1563983 RepID=A0A6V7LDP4_9HYME
MLDTTGKILERVIQSRVEAAIGNSLEDNQYGFRKGRSTIDAINQVVNTSKVAIAGTRWKGGTKEYCLLAALDVRNAFDSGRWDAISRAVDNLQVANYFRRIIKSYLSDRLLMYETEHGQRSYRITGGVPQGSVLGPLLWNGMYDEMLKLKLPRRAEIVAFADDAGLVIVAKHLADVRRIFCCAYEDVQQWMGSVGLTLAAHKAEAVLFTSRKQLETITRNVGECSITSKPYIRYLGVMLDSRLSYTRHVDQVTEKASRVAMSLAPLIPNIGGP